MASRGRITNGRGSSTGPSGRPRLSSLGGFVVHRLMTFRRDVPAPRKSNPRGTPNFESVPIHAPGSITANESDVLPREFLLSRCFAVSRSPVVLASAPDPQRLLEVPGVPRPGPDARRSPSLHGLDLLLFSRVAELAGQPKFNAFLTHVCAYVGSMPCVTRVAAMASLAPRPLRNGPPPRTARPRPLAPPPPWSRSRQACTIRRGPSSSSFFVTSSGTVLLRRLRPRPARPRGPGAAPCRVRTTSLPASRPSRVDWRWRSAIRRCGRDGSPRPSTRRADPKGRRWRHGVVVGHWRRFRDGETRRLKNCGPPRG